MGELAQHSDPMTQAGRDWMEGRLPSSDYFAMARRQARVGRPLVRSWRERVRGWWRHG